MERLRLDATARLAGHAVVEKGTHVEILGSQRRVRVDAVEYDGYPNLPAEAVAVELGGVEGRLGDLLWGDARHDMRFCQKRSVDRQRTVVECEHSLLSLDIDSEAGCRQEVVERIVAPTEVGGAAVGRR